MLVFTEGTVVDDRDQGENWKLFGGPAKKPHSWQDHGSTIVHLSSKRKRGSLKVVPRV